VSLFTLPVPRVKISKFTDFSELNGRTGETELVSHLGATCLSSSCRSLCQPLPLPSSLSFPPKYTRRCFRQRNGWWYLLLQLAALQQIQGTVSHTGRAQSCGSRGFIQNHNMRRNPVKRLPFIPLSQQTAAATPAITSRPRTALPPPVQCGGRAWTPPSGQRSPSPAPHSPAGLHAHQGALSRSAEPGAKGPAGTHGAYRGAAGLLASRLRRQGHQEGRSG